jgi:hypothetical protein
LTEISTVSRLDKILGLDDEVARRERAPLWKRAAWHALKNLVRKHPGAALAATASGAGYAVKQGVEEGAEAIKEKFDDVREALTPDTADVRENKRLMTEEAALVIESEVTGPEHDAPHAADAADPLHDLSDKEKKEFVESLAPADRQALAELAKKAK